MSSPAPAAAPTGSSPGLPPFRLDAPSQFNIDTYTGRVRHFLDVIDPSTLFTTDAELKGATSLLQGFADRQHQNLPRDPAVTDAQLWHARKITNAVLHPQTGEPIPFYARMSCFVPFNVPIVVGMLTTSSVAGQVYWQWINQSYNVVVNHANRNASNPMDSKTILKAYGTAVGMSVGMSIGLGEVVKRAHRFSPGIAMGIRAVVPYTAVASAGAANVFLMRRNEVDAGVEVVDAENNVVGISQIAGKKAVMQSALTRVALPAPILILPPVIMAALDRFAPMKPMARNVTQVGVITACLWGALPCAIALFPQVVKVPATELEPRFHNLTGKDGKPLSTLYFNRGL